MAAERLRGIPLFRHLSTARLSELSAALVEQSAHQGDAIFKEGDRADALVLVDEGHVQVVRGVEVVAVLGPGSFAGEMGLLLDERRTADLIAATDVRYWTLDRAALEALMAEHPELAVELSRELSARLVSTTRRLVPTSTAIVTAVWGDARLDELATDVERVVGAPPHVARDVEQLPPSAEHVLVVLSRDGATRRDARRTLRRASYVVCFAPPPAWVVRHHAAGRVLRCDGKMSVERAARWITNRSVGLALSSGGSKTVAHIGVLEALRSAGITIDAVAGCSGGALVALEIGLGHGTDTMKRHLRELADLLGFRRWDLNVPPRTGVMKGRRLRDAFDSWYEGKTFDDLVLPTVVVATDLASGEEVVIDSGSLADAARASLSMPGVFDPWPIAGRPMIDGAIVDPLPTGVLRDLGSGVVIASNVAGKEPEEAGLAEIPGVVQTMLRMINVSERELLKTRLPLADVVVRPSVAANYSFDFTRIDEFVAEGSRAARDALSSLRREGSILLA